MSPFNDGTEVALAGRRVYSGQQDETVIIVDAEGKYFKVATGAVGDLMGEESMKNEIESRRAADKASAPIPGMGPASG